MAWWALNDVVSKDLTDGSQQPATKRMRLRYAGACRLCESQLSAGAVAIYERSTKTVRCDECIPESAGTRETITEQVAGQEQELESP